MATESLREIAERLNRLAANPELIERYAKMRPFADGTAWTSMSLRNALEFALYQQPDRMSDACWTLRMAVADVEKGWRTTWWWTQDHTDAEYEAMQKALEDHPVWDIRIGELTPEEQKRDPIKTLPRNEYIWAFRMFGTDRQGSARARCSALKSLKAGSIDGYLTLYKHLCAAVEDVLAGRWPKQADAPKPPEPVVHTCEMKVATLRDGVTALTLCGKPVNATAPSRNGHWLCESCIEYQMKADNANWRERKQQEIERLRSDFNRPFKSPYLIGTGDLHGPKLL